MPVLTDFSKGKLPLRYAIYDPGKPITLKNIATTLLFLAIIFFTSILAHSIGKSAYLYGCVVMVIYLIIFRKELSQKKDGFIDFNDERILIDKGEDQTTIAANEIRSIGLKVFSSRRQTVQIFELTIYKKDMTGITVRADAGAFLKENSEHFHTLPPGLLTTVKAAKSVYKISLTFDEKIRAWY